MRQLTYVIGNLRAGLVAGNADKGELAVLSAKSGGAGGLSGEEGNGDGLDDGHGWLAFFWFCEVVCTEKMKNYVRHRKNEMRFS